MSIPGHTNNPNGRPVGKPNKRNQEIKEYADSQGVNPAFILVDILSGRTTELGNEPLEKFDYRWAIDTLMPYMYGKRKPVDSDGNDSNAIDDFLNALNDK